MAISPWVAYKALVQLGFQPVMLNALYRLGLATGHYKRTEMRDREMDYGPLRPLFVFPSPESIQAVIGEDGKAALLAEADEIAASKVRLFGATPADLDLSLPAGLPHWSAYETGRASLQAVTTDIKFLWEPARFGWAFCLGRAFHLTKDAKYAAAFWRNFEVFAASNPPYLGPNWTSGQEAALRLIAFIWAAQAFGASSESTPERLVALSHSVARHAERIPPTLIYARSQQNNHLLSEAGGLLTAGFALPSHPQAAAWCRLGWKWLNEGLQSQIDSYGEYAQHSTNYHRLMLQIVLWANSLVQTFGADRPDLTGPIPSFRWPRRTNEAIVRSVHWLLSILDPVSGQVPNLGANDGSYAFPFTICPFADYRPALNAAARAFLAYDLPRGAWDEMALWFGIPLENRRAIQLPRYIGDQVYGRDSWASLRTAQFTSRPSHADQLHVDLWWRGVNVARDPGTYSYNAAPPWDNRLTTALVHNTVTLDGHDQFTRATRFLYLDWFNAYRRGRIEADPAILHSLRGRHWGYWRQAIRHERTVSACADGLWRIEDHLLPLRLPWGRRQVVFRLHWLLPDWEWQLEDHSPQVRLRLDSPHGLVTLNLQGRGGEMLGCDLVRAGEAAFASGSLRAGPDRAIRGWYSPTYTVKEPALSLALEIISASDVQFISEFEFPL